MYSYVKPLPQDLYPSNMHQAQFLGWRAIFWFLTILAVAFLVPFVILFPETGTPFTVPSLNLA